MDSFDLVSISLPNQSKVDPIRKSKEGPPKHKPGEKFLKGPVPWNWIAKAAQLPGKAIQVGIVIWFLAGIKNSRTVPLSNKVLRDLEVSRHSQYRGLKALEKGGLVSVTRHAGRNPVVTILDSENVQHIGDEDS